MTPAFFALLILVILKYAFADMESGVKFQLRPSGGFFNHQRIKAKTLLQTSIIRFLLFTDDATLEELVNRFSVAFGLTISVKKMEVISKPPPCSKKTQGIKQPPLVQSIPRHSYIE